MSPSDPFASPDSPAFHTTRWTLVMRTRGDAPEARAALGDLCEAYWTPVYRFLRRERSSDDECKELTQEFFSRLLSGGGVENADPSKGRFRSYLLGALKNFLAKRRRAEGRQKRGGDVAVASIDAAGTDTSPGLSLPDPGATAPDALFDRQWALAVMGRGLASLQESFAESGKSAQFEALKPWLTGDPVGRSQADVATELGMTGGAVKVAIHRLRQKFGEAIRREVAETVEDESEVQEELRYLIEVVSTSRG